MCLAVPGKILSVTGSDLNRRGRVSFGGAIREINLAFTPEAVPDDYVMVHVGMAISVVEPAEAARIFAYLRGIAETDEVPASLRTDG